MQQCIVSIINWGNVSMYRVQKLYKRVLALWHTHTDRIQSIGNMNNRINFKLVDNGSNNITNEGDRENWI